MEHYQETLFDREDFSRPGPPELLEGPEADTRCEKQPEQTVWNGVPRQRKVRDAEEEAGVPRRPRIRPEAV